MLEPVRSTTGGRETGPREAGKQMPGTDVRALLDEASQLLELPDGATAEQERAAAAAAGVILDRANRLLGAGEAQLEADRVRLLGRRLAPLSPPAVAASLLLGLDAA